MKKKDIVEVIYQNSEYKKSDIQDIVDMVFDVMGQSMKEEDKIMIVLEYGLDMNYNHIADCTITMKVLAKEGK